MTYSPLSDLIPSGFALSGVHKEQFELTEDFLDLAARFSEDEGTVLLYSGGHHDLSRYHILGINPLMTLTGYRNEVVVFYNGARYRGSTSSLNFLDTLLQSIHLERNGSDIPIQCGLLGYLSYDLKHEIEEIPHTSVDTLHLPDILLYLHSLLVVHDTKSGQTFLFAPVINGNNQAAEKSIEHFQQRILAKPANNFFTIGNSEPDSNFSRQQYLSAVQRVIDYIKTGDAYQVNLSQRFSVNFSGSSYGYFRQLCQSNPAPFFAYIQGGDHQLVSTSPERFLKRKGGYVETRPIKGTRPRSQNPVEDKHLADELKTSTKDGAELAMIVDLMRNDLGKVCETGSIKVKENKRVEKYSNVFHLVSVIEGQLEQDRNSADIIKATFPGGSITGCPKVRAMEIIDELEPCNRHAYCGSIGYISFHDTMDLSISIRTAIIINDVLLFSVGGGIVYDSTPQAEYEETLHKGRSLLAACNDAKRSSSARETIWLNGRLLPVEEATVPVTDQAVLYGNGFFETIKATRGNLPLLQHHLDRFHLTWQKLFQKAPPQLSWQAVISQVLAANNLENSHAAVKILATRGSRNAAPWDNTLLVSARPYIHRLQTIDKEGIAIGIYPCPRQSPLAEYKTTNYLYYLHAGQWAKENGFDEALISNPDDTISETNTAAVFLVKDSIIIRPQADGALKSVMGVAASKLLKEWGYTIVEQPLNGDKLLQADHVFLANALMGAVPVRSINNRTIQFENNLCQRLNSSLDFL